MTRDTIIELAQEYSKRERYDDLVEKFIFLELKDKSQKPINVAIETPKDKLNDVIFSKITEDSLFCTNKNYLTGEVPFMLIDDEGEVILDYKRADDFRITRSKVPFEDDSDIDNFAIVIKWLQDEIKNICYINNEAIKLNYTLS